MIIVSSVPRTYLRHDILGLEQRILMRLPSPCPPVAKAFPHESGVEGARSGLRAKLARRSRRWKEARSGDEKCEVQQEK